MTSEKTFAERHETAIRIAALAIMDGITTEEDMRGVADFIADRYWAAYSSTSDNPAMWSNYLAALDAVSCVAQYWAACNHETIGCRLDERMQNHFDDINAVISEIEMAHRDVADVTDGIADVSLWPASTAPVTMTVDESDDIRMDDEDLPTRSFTETWCLPRSVSEDDMETEAGEALTPDEIAAMLYDRVDGLAHQWTDDDQKALDEMDALWAFEMDDDSEPDVVDEWTEWLVLAGELERIDTGDGSPIWAWCPDHRAELPGADDPISSFDEAQRIFDAYDPLGLWFAKRHAESMAGEEPQIWRRFEVDLVCQTCSRDSDGLISVRDDAVRLSKEFDVDGDMAAQTLIKAILSHI